MVFSLLSGVWRSATLPPSPQRLRRWKLEFSSASLCPQRSTQTSEKESSKKHSGPGEKSPEYGGGGATSSEPDEYVEVLPLFTTPINLFLVRLRLLRTMAMTVSQNELLALCQLAKARASLRDRLPVCTPRDATEQLAAAPGGPRDHQGLQPQQQHRGSPRRIRVNPLDVSALLLSGELAIADLPLLEELEETADELEAVQQREGRWCLCMWLLGLRGRRANIWEPAAAKLQQQAPRLRGGSCSSNRKLAVVAEGGETPNSLLHSNLSIAAGETLGMSEEIPEARFGGSLSGGLPSQGLCIRPSSGTGGAGAVERFQLSRLSSSSNSNFRGFLGRRRHPVRETGGDSEAAVKAVAASVSRMGSDSLALLPHSCKWPLATPARTRGSASGYSGSNPHPWSLQVTPQEVPEAGVNETSGASSPSEGWKAAVGFRLRHSRVSSRRRRELERRRQRLSPLDPPYDANALFLHPFCVTPSVDLPDVEEAKASEVHEVALDFLGRCKATEACAQCSRAATSSVPAAAKGSHGLPPLPRCPLHQRLHYRKIGEGPEKVLLIHGICMSGYFFADLIRVIFPESAGGPPGGDDPHERWRYTFYCVDLLGYGKSSAVPSAQNYSRREQAEAILRDVIVENGFTSVHLVGHSFGGLVAAELCEMLPAGFVTTLILLAPAYFESERQAMRILTALHFPVSHSVAHPYFGEFLLRLGVVLRPFFEPLVLSIVPRGELPQLSVADVFSIRPDALTGTIRSIVQDRVDRTFQILRQRGQRASLFHGTADGVIPIRQAKFLALRYSNIHVRALAGFVHHFPASHAQFTAHIVIQEIERSLRNGRGLMFSLNEDPGSSLIASHALLLPGHPTWD